MHANPYAIDDIWIVLPLFSISFTSLKNTFCYIKISWFIRSCKISLYVTFRMFRHQHFDPFLSFSIRSCMIALYITIRTFPPHIFVLFLSFSIRSRMVSATYFRSISIALYPIMYFFGTYNYSNISASIFVFVFSVLYPFPEVFLLYKYIFRYENV